MNAKPVWMECSSEPRACELFHGSECANVRRRRALPSTSINAESSIAAGGRAVIVVNRGLEAFLCNFMRAFATELRFVDEPGSVALDRAQKIQRLTQLMEWGNTPMSEPRMLTFDATPHQREFASHVTTESARFVVAHEFAHVVLHHHESAARAAQR